MKATVHTAATPPLAVRPTAKVKNDLSGIRMAREFKTMAAMVRIYCRDHHHSADELCAECRQFLDYAGVRLERCRFGEEKPTCAKCPVHCYQRDRREQARVVMRYAGPRMVWEHPIMSLRHWLDGRRPAPEL
ncbi:MAG TPA: nitrous oxide-stimulated promoter family protein [Verrucomicrobiae bacterium]